MSDYGINLKLNLEGNNKLRTLYQDFKNLETQINKTQQTIKDLTRKNKELKLEQSNLGAAIVGVGKGAEVTVKFIKALHLQNIAQWPDMFLRDVETCGILKAL